MRVTVTDGRGRRVADGGLARWLGGILPVRLRGEVAIALVSDARIRALNRDYRGKDLATDVLSFAPGPDEGAPDHDPRSTDHDPRSTDHGQRFFGDIVIAAGVARRQAREAGHAYRTELRVLALHGFLHLLGYDHDDPTDQGRMARAEARLRRRGGLREGLIARAAEGADRGTAAPARERARGWGPARMKKRQRPSRAAGRKRGTAAPARERARGWGPARMKK